MTLSHGVVIVLWLYKRNVGNLHCLLWQPVWYAKMVVHCQMLQVTVSRSIKPVITSKNMTKYEEKVHLFLTKANIFT